MIFHRLSREAQAEIRLKTRASIDRFTGDPKCAASTAAQKARSAEHRRAYLAGETTGYFVKQITL